MYNPFRQNCAQQPFLSPLGKHRRSLPALAMPLTVIIIGGAALVIASSALFSGMAIKVDSSDMAVAAIPATEEPATTAQVSGQEIQPDPSATPAPAPAPAAPETQALSFNAPIASNEADIAILEVIQIPPDDDEAYLAIVPQDKPDTPLAVAQASPAGLKNAQTNGAVNLRAAPDKNAKVLLVVPENVSIEAQDNCIWCAVTYEGSQGYIYKSFIDYR